MRKNRGVQLGCPRLLHHRPCPTSSLTCHPQSSPSSPPPSSSSTVPNRPGVTGIDSYDLETESEGNLESAPVQDVLKISNLLGDQDMLFRVQTTSPLTYRVKPSNGRIGAGESVSIQGISYLSDL